MKLVEFFVYLEYYIKTINLEVKMCTKGDFHIHTIISDGYYTPTEVVIMAKEAGLDIIAITDHNTIDGIEEALEAGEKTGVKVIPGIELSTRYKGRKVHVLGYFKIFWGSGGFSSSGKNKR